MIKNKQAQGGPLQTFMIVILVLGFISAASLTFLTSLGNEYGATVGDEAVFETFSNSSTGVIETTEQMRNSLNDLSSGNIITIAEGFFTGGWNAIKLFTTDIPQFFNDIINTIADRLNMPLLPLFVYTIGFISVLFGVITIIMKVRG